jgi:hypothetical protein
MADLEQQLADVKQIADAKFLQAAPSADDLESQLTEVKQLFNAKFQECKTQGAWSVTRGKAPTLECLEVMLAEVKGLLVPQGAPTLEDLEEELGAVKELFAKTCGDFVDGWSVVRGAAPSVTDLELHLHEVKMLMPEFHCPQLDDLEEDLASVKQLFTSELGDFVDNWTVTRGAAPALESLEQGLLEVKLLHESMLGAADIEQSSGITWAVSHGVTRDIPTIDSLGMELHAVKSIFLTKFGITAESED